MSGAPEYTGWRRGDPPELLMTREWLATNGLGGYASASLAGFCTRRFHGLMIAGLPAPLGRMQFLPYLEEHLAVGEHRVRMTGRETRDATLLPDLDWLDEVGISMGFPLWRYRNGSIALERRVMMPYMRNVAIVRYSLAEDAEQAVRLELRPFIHMRPHEGRVDEGIVEPRRDAARDGQRFECPGYPPLTIRCRGQAAEFAPGQACIEHAVFRVERNRGYDYLGPLLSPGSFVADLQPGAAAALELSVEDAPFDRDADEAFAAEIARRRDLIGQADARLQPAPIAQLVLAADQFIIAPQTRAAESAGSDAGPERTIVAGYHWFTDWGRDTMISLEGLCLLTGRLAEADRILRMFGRHARYGLIPNMFPEAQLEGRYHTADASLWFFHALDRYLGAGGKGETLALLLPVLCEIMDRHLEGTRFGIRVDPRDGLLAQGEDGYQLTWMDAKVEDWVVTPRRGKAVEINALFYNALVTLASWLEPDAPALAARYAEHAARCRSAFNRRFWNPDRGYLYDVVDGEDGRDDPSLRPNQILAIALAHPVLANEYWQPVMDAVERALWTPVGLRTLAPEHPDYKPFYDGDLRARDAAYHQGTVWPWLMGPFIDAWLKVYRDDSKAARFVAALYPHLAEGCIGTICEIFDAESPFLARGCTAQAWSIAELIRVTALLAPRDGPDADRH